MAVQKQATRKVEIKSLGIAFGYMMRNTSIRSYERIEREASLFLEHCGIDKLDQEEAQVFRTGYQEGYLQERSK